MASSDFDRLDFQSGNQLMAADLQTMRDEIRGRVGDIQTGNGIDAQRDSTGNIRIATTGRLAFVGVASSDISPRSGSTWGTGTVTVYGFDGANDYTLGVDYDVVNPSSTTMTSGHGIDSGMYCWVQEDQQGWLIVTPLECA